MSHIIYTEEFIQDFELLYMFLAGKNPLVARKLAKLLDEKLTVISNMPKAFNFLGDFRLYLLEFGSSGYAILYDFDEDLDMVNVLRIKHQKEVGF